MLREMAGGPERPLTDLERAATSLRTGDARKNTGPDLPHSVKTGLVLLGRYELTAKVASGGMASVWRGRDRNLEREVAIKFTTRFEQVAVDRFKREALLTARLGTPNIVQVFDAGVHEAIPFLVMEFLEGETLAERLLSQGPLRATEAVQIFSQVAHALGDAHAAGIIHRDLKPSNLFLVGRNQLIPKILDFGVAKDISLDQTKPGDFMGTPNYMSAEQALDPSAVDSRSDFFSLAVVVYEAMVGEQAFGGNNMAVILQKITIDAPPIPSDHAPLPQEFDEWFARAAHRNPEMRFQTAGEFESGLRHALLERESRAYSRRTDPPAEPIPETRPPATISVAPVPQLSSRSGPTRGDDDAPASEPIGSEPGDDESVEASLQSVLPPARPSKTVGIVATICVALVIIVMMMR